MNESMMKTYRQFHLYESLENLLHRLSDSLPRVPGFRTLSLFGSMAEKRADEYSDIDLILTTDDLPTAKESLFSVLEEGIGAIESCWVISLRPDEWNPTIIFTDEGYYHKLDLGLVSSNAASPTIPPEQTMLLKKWSGEYYSSVPSRECRAYLPLNDSVGHFLLGQIICGIRYCKARKRGHHLSCYRFVTAAADWCMRTLYVRLLGIALWQGKLSTDEYAVLDCLDPSGKGRDILTEMDYSTSGNMDKSLCSIFRHMHRLCQEIAASRNECLEESVIERMLAFMQSELNCP